ncbi:MAG: Cytochrome c oxidase subunit 5A [Marteilia pararefringens]
MIPSYILISILFISRRHFSVLDELYKTEDVEDSYSADAKIQKVLSETFLHCGELRSVLQHLHRQDFLPEPKLVNLIFEQCHHLNDLPLALRFMESIHVKCGKKHNYLYQYIMKETTACRRKLGIPTIEELEYNTPHIFIDDSEGH